MTIKISKLANGLRVVTDSVPSVESVAVGVWIGTGTRAEAMAQNGAAHMVEHMLFKGTHKRSAYEIAEVIENVGGNVNAYTSREVTSYHIHLLKEDLPLAIDVLADIVQHSTMPPDEVERERDVILQEIGMCHDTPDDLVFDLFSEVSYPGQSFGAPILGTPATIAAMRREDLMGFVYAHYVPENMVLCAAGNVQHDAVVALAEAMFSLKGGARPQDFAPACYSGGEVRLEKELEQAHIVLGFQAMKRLDPLYYAGQALSTLLGGGMSSRLFQEVREKRGLVYSIFSFHSAYRDDGQFGIYAGTGPERLPELIPVMCDEILKVTQDVSEDEVARAKAQLRASLLMGWESMMARADHLAKAVLSRGQAQGVAEIIEGIAAVDRAAILRAAQQIFVSPPVLAGLGPLSSLEGFEAMKARLVA